MELDELIRTARPEVMAAPDVSSLRAHGRRRRARNRRRVLTLVVCAVGIAVIAPQVLRDSAPRIVVSGETHGATPAGWSMLGEVPFGGMDLRIVAVGSRIAVVSDHETNPGSARPQHVSVAMFDPSTATSVDLGFAAHAGSDPPTDLHGTTAWGDALVVLSRGPAGYRLDRFVDGTWTRLAMPAGAPADLVWTGVSSIAGQLYLSSERRESGISDAEVWRTADGDSWEHLPAPGVSSDWGSTLVEVPDGLIRWTGGGQFSAGIEGELFSESTGRWTPMPDSPVDAMWLRKGAWTGSALLGCGAHTQATRYDCLSWTPGADRIALVDPPPLPQTESMEGFGSGMQVVWDGDRLVVAAASSAAGSSSSVWYSYRPDEAVWRDLPVPPTQLGNVIDAVTAADGQIYVVAVDVGGDVARIARLRADDAGTPSPAATDTGSATRVVLPSQRWTWSRSPDGQTLTVTDGRTVEDGAVSCPELGVEFSELDAGANSFPWPGTDEMVKPTPICQPSKFQVWGDGRFFEVRVHRSGPSSDRDAADLAAVIGRFRAERFGRNIPGSVPNTTR